MPVAAVEGLGATLLLVGRDERLTRPGPFSEPNQQALGRTAEDGTTESEV